MAKATNYAEWLRRDVLEEIPPDTTTLLSVGCYTGLTEAQLVRNGIHVVGIEIDPGAAVVARQRGLRVIEGDAATADVADAPKPYDVIVYADVLEHLVDPVAVLQRHARHLKPGGTVYVSIPNFRHYSVFWELFVRGHVRYRDAGILDRTHLRLTTRKMVQQWFKDVGLESVKCKYINNRKKAKLIAACFLGLAQEFTAVQIGILGRKPY